MHIFLHSKNASINTRNGIMDDTNMRIWTQNDQSYPLSEVGTNIHFSIIEAVLQTKLHMRIRKEREKSVVIAVELGDSLPETLIVEILSWLPVKALLQFKSVCKSWYSIISSPVFISKHLQNYYNHNDTSDCLLTQYTWSWLSEAGLQISESLLDETHKVLANEVLYEMPMYGSYICGPCNGIYYVYLNKFTDRALWNPAINECKALPQIVENPHLNPIKWEFYSFGYDPTTEDYKVVVIGRYYSAHYSEVFIYSLKSDSWRYWGDLPQNYRLIHNKCYIYVNGCCYWLGKPEVIICFDLIGEVYKEIHVPNYAQPAWSKSLAVYGNSVAFLCFHEVKKHFDMWTFNDGVWTRKFTMGPIPNLWRPIGHWNDDKILFDDAAGNLLLCDTTTEEIKLLDCQHTQGRYEGAFVEGAYVYKESLVSFKGYENKDTIEKSD